LTGGMRKPIVSDKPGPMTKVIFTIRDNQGRKWVAAGLLAAAHPIAHVHEPIEIEDMEELAPSVLGFSVVLDMPDHIPFLDVSSTGNPELVAPDGIHSIPLPGNTLAELPAPPEALDFARQDESFLLREIRQGESDGGQ
jgi:hypothetical protein